MKPLHVQLRRLACVLPIYAIGSPVHANADDPFKVAASYSLSRDDNLFRLPNKDNATALIGRNSAAETIKATTASLIIDKSYGLQHLDLRVDAVKYDYQNFDYLNFTATNYSGGLRWNLTPRIRGNITASRQQTLNNFADFRNFGQQNQRTLTNTRADAIYELDGAYQLVGAASRIRLRNGASFIEQRAFDLQSVDGGIRRVFTSGSELTYRLRKGSGDYTATSFAAVGFLPSTFDDITHELSMVWAFSAKTRIDARIAYLDRKYSEFSFRDYSGVLANANLDWQITSRTGLEVAFSRDLTDFQSLYSSYSVNNRLVMTPKWQVMEKVAVKFSQELSRRSFPGAIPGVPISSEREDKAYLSRLGMVWQPREQIEISAWLLKDRRKSNYQTFNYTSKSIGLLAQLSF